MTTLARSSARTGLLRSLAGLLLALTFVFGSPAQAQNDNPTQLLEDFVHYALIARPDLAVASAEALMDSGLTNAELAVLLDDGPVTQDRFDRAVLRSQMVDEMADSVAELARRIEEGRLDLARDDARIEEAIQMLIGNQRQRLLARNRLERAGEYAVPRLLNQITEGRNEQLRTACEDMLRRVGRLAVTPLCVALPELADPVSQRVVCDLLGEIGYPHAAPTLKELADNPSAAPPVRDAAARAFDRVGGVDAPLTILYSNLARQYFNGAGSLYAYPYEERNNVWEYDAFVGLVATQVRTDLFGSIMAMKNTRKAIEISPNNADALSLFVAANLRRENDLQSAGTDDPIYGDMQYSPAFYATVFGTSTCLDVLGLAIDSVDTTLVRDAIKALNQTTGGSNLFAGNRSRQPLLEAMQYPDRRVQYEAALTLGSALPRQSFSGQQLVVPTLASAVRLGGTTFALVIADNDEDQQVTASRLEGLGFTVLGAATSIHSLDVIIAEAVGIDLVVLRQGPEDADETMSALRNRPKTAAVPVLVVASALDRPVLRREYRGDRRVKVSVWGNEENFEASIDDLMLRAAGGRLDQADAEIYAIESLGVLRDIALNNSPVYNIRDAEGALIEAMAGRTGGTRMLVARILSLIDSPTAQRAVLDAALNAEEGEQVELLGYAADSVKRFGNQTEDRQLKALLRLVADATGSVADAAARVHGALNLPPAQAVELLP
jgi:CheY-like chemotaxis protein